MAGIASPGVAMRRLAHPAPLALVVVAGCWTAVAALTIAGQAGVISHDAIIEKGRLPLPVALVAFVAVWQLMTGAMMLPTTLPILAVYGRLVRAQPRPRATVATFVAAYFVVWTLFAILALAGDSAIHWSVDHVPWMDEHQWLIGGSLLMGAGVFQLTSLKERCLTECRNPLQFVWSRYSPGLGGAWRLGVAHALFCLGCCWALMLVMFGLGVGSLSLMAAVTGVMVLEKSSPFGGRLVPLVSLVLIVLGLTALAGHAWLAALPRIP